MNDIGLAENCELVTNWHVNKDGNLDSGVGLKLGQKLQMKAFPFIDNVVNEGIVKIKYRIEGINPSEKFRIGIDG